MRAVGPADHAVLLEDRAAAAREMLAHRTVLGIEAEVDDRHAAAGAGGHRDADRIVGVEHDGLARRRDDQSLDAGEVVDRVDAVLAEVVAADVDDDADVAAVEREAALEDAAARRLEHRELDLGRRQYRARGPVAGAVAGHDATSADRDALGRRDPGHEARALHHVRDREGGRGLAVGAGDRDDRNATVAPVREQRVDDRTTGVVALAEARMLVHADARRRVDLDQRAALRGRAAARCRGRRGRCRRRRGRSCAPRARRPHAVSGCTTPVTSAAVPPVDRFALPRRRTTRPASGTASASSDWRPSSSSAAPSRRMRLSTFMWPVPRRGSAFSASTRAAHRRATVADDLRRHASRGGDELVADHERAVVVADDGARR